MMREAINDGHGDNVVGEEVFPVREVLSAYSDSS
jgi:hypothetical protein